MSSVPIINNDAIPFSSLPKRKRTFILEYVKSGDLVEAYTLAGYKESRQSKMRAGKLLREIAPYLQTALNDYVSSVEMGVIGQRVLINLAEDSDMNGQVRFNAAKELRARSVPVEDKEAVVVHKHQGLADSSLDGRIAALTASLQKQGVLEND